MNLLQLVCNEEAVEILIYITQRLENKSELKLELVEYRDAHLGS